MSPKVLRRVCRSRVSPWLGAGLVCHSIAASPQYLGTEIRSRHGVTPTCDSFTAWTLVSLERLLTPARRDVHINRRPWFPAFDGMTTLNEPGIFSRLSTSRPHTEKSRPSIASALTDSGPPAGGAVTGTKKRKRVATESGGGVVSNRGQPAVVLLLKRQDSCRHPRAMVSQAAVQP